MINNDSTVDNSVNTEHVRDDESTTDNSAGDHTQKIITDNKILDNSDVVPVANSNSMEVNMAPQSVREKI